jgi:dienelactone hydrolase
VGAENLNSMIKKIGIWLALVLVATHADAAGVRKLDFPVRGKTLTLTVYEPPRSGQTPAKGTIVMGSGDVGWVGLGPAMADDFSALGYIVVGVNVRQYLSTFTEGKQHLDQREVRDDYGAMSELLRRERLLQRPVIVSGVSEGAALAVLAGSDPKNHVWIDGVITMGLPPSAELAWRWTDVASWVTKRDADEPSFAPHEVIASVSPVPLVMIQSRKDEYVSESDYKRFESTARDPKKLVLIDASNHRFTDRRPELRAAYASGLDWIRSLCRVGEPRG